MSWHKVASHLQCYLFLEVVVRVAGIKIFGMRTSFTSSKDKVVATSSLVSVLKVPLMRS